MNGFRNIVITGASGGLGTALARQLAGPDRAFLLFGRDPDRLRQTGEAVREHGAWVELCSVPLEDHAGFDEAIARFDAAHPIDLFIANAGVKTGNVDGLERLDLLHRTVAVNLGGTICSVQSALSHMQGRGAGRIAIVSSLSAISPQGGYLSYSATKAALRAYAVALRRRCRQSGVGISVVLPGFIDTAMTDRNIGPAPFMMSPERAALRIVKGLDAGRAEIVFPRRLATLIRLQNLLPVSIGDRIAAWFDAEVLPDRDERKDDETPE